MIIQIFSRRSSSLLLLLLLIHDDDHLDEHIWTYLPSIIIWTQSEQQQRIDVELRVVYDIDNIINYHNIPRLLVELRQLATQN